MENWIYIIILLPLIGFLLNGIFGKKLPKILVGSFATFIVFSAFLISLSLFLSFDSNSSPIIIKAFEWFKIGDIGVDFAFQIDQLSLVMMLIITGIGTLIHLYSIEYMKEDSGFYKFFSYLNLFIFSMLLLVMGSNYLILFIGWEGVGLCSYLLIGFWYQNPDYVKAAKKAFTMNRIADLGILVGIFLLANNFQALDYLSVAKNSTLFEKNEPILIFITLSLFVGAMGKSAQFPLFTWLPDAMAGPTPVSALIHAATMVTAGIYLIVRSNFLYTLAPTTLDFVLYIGLATSLIGAFIALRQNDIKKVLAYSTVSQLGLLFIALGVGAYTSAMFHLITHAFFKALLFLGSGSVIHAMSGEQDLRMMGGLKNKIPVTYWTFLIGTLAIIGIPPLSGMISKDEILVSIYAKNPIIWFLTLFSAGLTSVYMLRLLFLAFYGNFRGTKEQEAHIHESPLNMTLPLVVLSALSILGGFINLPHFISHGNFQFLANWISPILVYKNSVTPIELSTEIILLFITVTMVIVLFFVMKNIYVKKGKLPLAEYEGWEKLSAQKLYIDDIYEFLFVKPIKFLAQFLFAFDKKVLDASVNLAGKSIYSLGNLSFSIDKLLDKFVNLIAEMSLYFGRFFRRIQNGDVQTYILVMSLSIGIILIFNFLFQR